ncbi:MAG TPA: tRNA uridine(34) 5-carboxymethylaminomethyl modification radical SAM/GNAT enzyme Elp3 [Nitrososphaera sp.]|nr:tRNA uridine(34) 5-carboxymethylaminomethyl modification radical SAM/GNAT enzyme Elp3 [Nitrososphaera sp.]
MHEGNNYQEACKSIARRIESKNLLSVRQVLHVIRDVSSMYHLPTMPKNEHIIQYLHDSQYKRLLMVKPNKTASGVAVIAVMPNPYRCPHGRCIYCPGGIKFNTPLSYTGTEPVTRAAQKFNYDPYYQACSKMEQLQARGHDTGKTEIVIVGGTFPFMPAEYQRNFAKSCYDALNGFPSSGLQQSMEANEIADNRCVGFTVETKPDYCKKPHIELMLELGVTRVEIGVQSLRNDVYKKVNRGHTLDDVIDAFRIARDAGYKIVAHMMPGLPGSSPQKDIQDFRRLFQDDEFKPDMLKVYPTLVLEHTALFKMHQSGKYHAYSDEDLLNVIVEAKKIVPPWVRIMRVQREIQSKDIVAGPKSGNLRQIVLQKLRQQGYKCRCIRCREAGLQRKYVSEDEVELKRIDYNASNGREIFLSYESKDGDALLGFLRLRKVAKPYRRELTACAIVRELHIYGQVVGIGKKEIDDSCQHRGYGRKLLEEAERITKDELGVSKIAIISAVGTRQYYKKLGYHQDGPYVSKVL